MYHILSSLLFLLFIFSAFALIPTCPNQDGTMRNSITCECGSDGSNTKTCNVKKNVDLTNAGEYCIGQEYPIKCYDHVSQAVELSDIYVDNNQTCEFNGLENSDATMKNKICTAANPCNCKFSGPRCSLQEGVSNDETCVCGNTACSRGLGVICNRDNEYSHCSFAPQCKYLDGDRENSNICACGSTHCDSTTGLYCRDLERLGLPMLKFACTKTKRKIKICENRDGTIPNKITCQCGTKTCSKFSGLLCQAKEQVCLRSECSAQAIESMNETKMCGKFSPRCECSRCKDGYYGSDCAKCPADANLSLLLDCMALSFMLYCAAGLLYYVFRPANKTFKAQAMTTKTQASQLYRATSLSSSMISVIISQIQIISVILSNISWSPNFPTWIIKLLNFLGSMFSVDFMSLMTSFQCSTRSTPLNRWYVALATPFFLILLFILWYFCSYVWFKYLKSMFRKKEYCGPTDVQSVAQNREVEERDNNYYLDVTYAIIFEAAVNVLLIGIYKTVAQTAFKIFDCTEFSDKVTGKPIVSKLIMDHSIVCPHSYFWFWFADQQSGYEDVDPTPAIFGMLVCLVWCILPFFYINYALIRAVRNASDGGESIEELQKSDRSFKLKFGWAVNKYRTFPQKFETKIVGIDHGLIIVAACIWETFNAVVKLVVVASATLMFSEKRRIAIILIVSLSILLHWLFRPYREPLCNVMVVVFGISDLLGIVSSPQSHVTILATSINNDTSDIFTPASSEEYEKTLQDATILQTIFLCFLSFTVVLAFYLTISSVVKQIREKQKREKMDIIRKEVEAEMLSGDSLEKRRLEEQIAKKKKKFTTCEKVRK
jgi:hypothetical protein